MFKKKCKYSRNTILGLSGKKLRMNGMGSECSSGCESGWTMYLDNSSVSPNSCKRDGVFCDEEFKSNVAKEENEDDLSIVSVESSGPPHFLEDEDFCHENGCFVSASSATELVMKRNKRQKIKLQQHPSLLDDTASSPIISLSKNQFTVTNQQALRENTFEFSQRISATHFKGRSTFKKHFGSCSPLCLENQPKKNIWFARKGSKRK